jgi:Mitochondrial ribosomal death-associated protein 3
MRRDPEQHQENFISFEAMKNILCDFTVEEFDHRETPLLVTPHMTTLFHKVEESVQRNRKYKSLLQGPSGVGKTTTLLYIGHMARAKGYVVFPIQARDFVNETQPLSGLISDFLLNWIDAEGETKLKEIKPRIYQQHETLWDLLNHNHQDEKVVMDTFYQLVRELKLCATKPVVFLVDQCNSFHTNPQSIKLYSDSEIKEVTPKENPVGAMFLNWNTFKVNLGGIFFGYSSAFQLMPTARDGNASLFSRIEPMNRGSFKVFVDFLVTQNLIPEECDCIDFFELCGGIPREAREFGSEKNRLFGDSQSNYQQWKNAYMNARIPFYKTRIQRLLDKKKLGPMLLKESVSFASSLFVSEKMTSALDVWIASGLIVTKDGFHKLFCPAAEKAILSVFDESMAMRQAIDIFRNDPQIKWRSLELAVVYLFRHLRGRPITFQYTDLCGTNKRSLMITAGLIEHGGNFAPMANSIPRNTLFVCTRNTPVVDFFIHDANGAQILIQCSESCYRDHKAKYDPDDHDVQVYVASTLNPIADAELKYIYLTPNTSLMAANQKRSKHYRKDVFLVAGDDMKRLFRDLFD